VALDIHSFANQQHIHEALALIDLMLVDRVRRVPSYFLVPVLSVRDTDTFMLPLAYETVKSISVGPEHVDRVASDTETPDDVSQLDR
jgi:hypothetical protein